MAPITLSKSQFGKTSTGQKPGASYANYLGYVARHRAAKVASQNADPFAPTSPQDINATVNKYTAGYGAPASDAQIQSSATAQLDPIIAAITGNIQNQAKASSGAIAANSAALAKALGGIDYAAPYQQATHDQAAVDAALQQSLNGGGAALSADLTNRLGMIDDPSVAATAGGLAQRGTAIGTNELASGNTNLGSLLASAAAAKSYGQKQPGIAGLAGLQDIAGVGRDATTKIGDATTQIEQLLPQIVSSLRSERDTKQGNKVSLAAQLYQTLTGQNVTKATAKAGLENTAFDNAQSVAPMPDPSLSNSVHHLVDQYGNPILGADGKQIPTGTQPKAKVPKAGKPLTVSEKTTTSATANTIAAQAFHGAPAVMNADGSIKDEALAKLSYQQALDEMRQEGLLADPRTAKIAIAALNRLYGSPASHAKTNAAVKSGLGVPKLDGPLSGLGSAPTATPKKKPTSAAKTPTRVAIRGRSQRG